MTMDGARRIMVCNCDKLQETFFLDEAPSGWLDALEELEAGDWKTLRRCSSCSALYAVDAWDKGHHQVVARLVSPERWQEEAESIDRRKALLLRSRGGADDARCIWSHCEAPRVQGVAYCLDHLWSTGARR